MNGGIFIGTRHLIAVVINDEYKVAQYGQWDGYPSGQGVDVLSFLQKVRLDKFKEAVSECEWVTQEYIDEINKSIDKNIKNFSKYDWKKDYPELHRDSGAKILHLILFDNKRKLKNSIDFAGESWHCEWAYVIDFDKNTFEVYTGYNKLPLLHGERFFNLTNEEVLGNDIYYPVRHFKTYDLFLLPTEKEFLEQCNIPDDDYDDTDEPLF